MSFTRNDFAFLPQHPWGLWPYLIPCISNVIAQNSVYVHHVSYIHVFHLVYSLFIALN